MKKQYPFWIRWILRPILSIALLELGLSFVPIPDWWETAIFNDYLYSTRINKMFSSELEYNSLGYRDTEWQADQKSILFLGDSRTYGLFVPREQTYATQVEFMSGWQGLNAGVPGATTFEAIDSMMPDGLPYKPSASVVCLDLNSSLISYVPRSKASKRSDVFGNFVRSFSTWMMLEGAWHSVFSERAPIIPLEEYGQQLDTIFETLTNAGVTQNVLLVGWTPLEDYPNLYTQEIYNQYREKSREVARRRNIPIIEFTTELKGLSLEQAFVGEHQIHLSAIGHRRIASSILRVLNDS